MCVSYHLYPSKPYLAEMFLLRVQLAFPVVMIDFCSGQSHHAGCYLLVEQYALHLPIVVG